jgi:hypothetical protein
VTAPFAEPAATDFEGAEPLPDDGAPLLTLDENAPPKPAPSHVPSSIARLPQTPPSAGPHERSAPAARRGDVDLGPGEPAHRENPAPESSDQRDAPAEQGHERRHGTAPAGRPGRAAKPARRSAPKARLKDMLGFKDSPAPAAHPTPATESSAATGHPAETALPVTRGAAALPDFSAPPAAPPQFQTPVEPAEEGAHTHETAGWDGTERRSGERSVIDEGTLQRALEAALHSFVGREPESKSAAEEFLSGSPVFDAKPRPVRRRNEVAEHSFRTPTAIAVGAIAAEAESLGVPERHRAITRAAMLDLAGHLDQHDLTWQTLREAVHFVMEYPMLARRVLPLLLPYLEEAA